MERFTLENDIRVFCTTAKSFPDGALEAHQKLHALVPYSPDRKYFGISRPEHGQIIYKAAAEELQQGELSRHGLDEFVIKKGEYIFLMVRNLMQNIPEIGKAFEKLVHRPDIDPDGYCIEWYVSQDDVKCMVKLK